MDLKFSSPEPATPAVQSIADKVRPQLEQASGKKFEKYVAVLFISVENIYYLIKVDIGGGLTYHIKVEVQNEVTKLLHFQANLPEDAPLRPTYVLWPHGGPITP